MLNLSCRDTSLCHRHDWRQSVGINSMKSGVHIEWWGVVAQYKSKEGRLVGWACAAGGGAKTCLKALCTIAGVG
jgi:hypothetical protein